MKVSSIKTLMASAFLMLFVCGFTPSRYYAKSTTVYIFLSETCPICQSYTLTLKELYAKYKDQNVKFVGVFPNYYSTQNGIDEFKKKYSIPFALTLDKKGIFTQHFKATTTPEVFVESVNHQLLYSGRIDDAFYSLGKRRTIITTTELADALAAIVSQQTVKTPSSQAVGCIITASK